MEVDRGNGNPGQAQANADTGRNPCAVDPRSCRYFRRHVCGGLIGWLIDSAIRRRRIGHPVGMFVGGLLGRCGHRQWHRVAGAVLVLRRVLHDGGRFRGIALWNPGPNSFVMFIPSGISVIVGAIVGLGLAVFCSASCSGHDRRTIRRQA
jgi:hypothetical protein